MAYGRSVFPEQLDSFIELLDLNADQRINATRYKELKLKTTLTTAEQSELNGLLVTLQNYILTPEIWNKTNDCLVGMETFITDTWKNYYKYIGDYNGSITYKAYNSVRYTDGNIYMALQDVIGVLPTDNTKWLKLSSKGDRGLTHKGNYNGATAYIKDDVVNYNGSAYICILSSSGNLPTDTTYWNLLTSKGDAGVGLIYRGVYSASTAYVLNDLVTRYGSTYYCKQNNTGVLPEGDSTQTYWNVYIAGGGENLGDLQTTNKTSLVGAVNEVNTNTNTNTTAIGTLSNLTTTEKNNLVGAVSEVNNIVKNNVVGALSLSTSTPVASIDGKVNGGLDFEMEAAPLLVNLLGKDGDCEDISKWNLMNGTIALDVNNKVYGANSICATATVAGTGAGIQRQIVSLLSSNKYYVVTGYLKAVGTQTSGIIQVVMTGDTSPVAQTSAIINAGWTKIVVKVATPANLTSVSLQLRLGNAGTVIGDKVYIDGVLVKEITAAEYADANYVPPDFINGIQPMMGLYLQSCGKNLFDKSTVLYGHYLNTSGVPTVPSTPDSGCVSDYIAIKTNTQYTASGKPNISTASRVCFYDKNYSFISAITYNTLITIFTTPSNARYLRFTLVREDLDTYQLEEGSTATTYEPYQGSELLIDGEFAGINSYRDKLTYRNGKASVLRNVKKIILDGSLNWAFGTDSTGYKTVQVNPLIPINSTVWRQALAEKYDRKALSFINPITGFDQFYLLSDAGTFVIAIVDTESGWGETYTPSTAEIAACMNGWKMNNGTFGTPYNGTGTKTWTKWNATNNTGAVTTVPTTKADGWNGWATLWYALVNPVEEMLPTPINGLSIYKGKTTVSLQTGIVKEKANPYLASGSYYINRDFAGDTSKLRYKAQRIIDILKNENSDLIRWTIENASAGSPAYGLQRAAISQALYDPAATYEVIYEVLPEEYNNQQASITAEYVENLLDSHNELVKTVSGVENDIAVLDSHLEILNTEVDTHIGAVAPHSGHVNHSLATAVNDFLVASGAGAFVKKTLAEVKTILGLGSAAYTASTDYAISTHNHDTAYTVKSHETDTAKHITASGIEEMGMYTNALGYVTSAINDCAYAEGKYTFSGEGKLYIITSFDNTAKTITLNTSSGLSVGDYLQIKECSIQDTSSYHGVYTNIQISAINGNVVTLNTALTINSDWKYVLLATEEDRDLEIYIFPTHAEGYETLATGGSSHAEGYNTIASGGSSHAGGLYNQAKFAQTAIGQYGTVSTASDTTYAATTEAFMIGNGTSTATRGLAFKVLFNGNTYADAAYTSTGADYAEYFEWLDRNIDNEDRVGYFVTLEEDKIRKSNSTDNYILGIISATPSVVGDNQDDHWQGKYLTDDWGRIKYHEVIVPDKLDNDGNIIISEYTEIQPIYNPDWDTSIEYTPREKRKEWSAVGVTGKLLVRDDGTCVANGYCKSNDDGIATYSENGFRVMKRISDNIIQIFVK